MQDTYTGTFREFYYQIPDSSEYVNFKKDFLDTLTAYEKQANQINPITNYCVKAAVGLLGAATIYTTKVSDNPAYGYVFGALTTSIAITGVLINEITDRFAANNKQKLKDMVSFGTKQNFFQPKEVVHRLARQYKVQELEQQYRELPICLSVHTPVAGMV